MGKFKDKSLEEEYTKYFNKHKANETPLNRVDWYAINKFLSRNLEWAKDYANKVSDKSKVMGTYPKSYTASDILRDELKNAGIKTPSYGNAAHHIVPWNDSRALDARTILDKFGIEYNSAANGVFLPYEVNEYVGVEAMHIGNHGREYIDEVTKRLQEIERLGGQKNDIINALNEIRKNLLDGTLKLN